MTNEQKSKVGRREFLRVFGASATVAAAAAAPLSGAARADSETKDEKRKARYKADSPHIQTYYRVNRYPTK
jgi:nitrous oxide reductase